LVGLHYQGFTRSVNHKVTFVVHNVFCFVFLINKTDVQVDSWVDYIFCIFYISDKFVWNT